MKIYIVGDNDIDKNKYILKLKTGQIYNCPSTELFQFNKFKYNDNSYELINVSSIYAGYSERYDVLDTAEALIIMLPGIRLSNNALLYWYNLTSNIPIVVIRAHCGNDSTGRRFKRLSDNLGIQYRDLCLDIDNVDILAEPLEYLLDNMSSFV